MKKKPYIWHSSSVLKQTFSKVWGNLLDITLDEGHVSFARWKKRELHLLHSKSIPTMNIAIEGDDHDFLVKKNNQIVPTSNVHIQKFPPELCGCSRDFWPYLLVCISSAVVAYNLHVNTMATIISTYLMYW